MVNKTIGIHKPKLKDDIETIINLSWQIQLIAELIEMEIDIKKRHGRKIPRVIEGTGGNNAIS